MSENKTAPKDPVIEALTDGLGLDPQEAQMVAAQPDSNDETNPTPNPGDGSLHPAPAQAFARDPRRNKGGPATHKPGCICRPCSARRREKEAQLRAAGVELTGPKAPSRTNGVLNADLPPIVVRGRSLRDRIADWAILRATRPNITNKDIAAELGITEGTLNVMITRATKEGWLVFEDPMKRLEHQILPMVVDNLHGFVKDKDRQVTIEVAKGALFPAYKEHKGISESPQTVLAIKIEPAQGNVEVADFKGTIVGTPRSLGES